MSESNDENNFDQTDFFPEIIELEITDVIDLHSIPPPEIKAVIEEYLYQAQLRGFRFLRIIHGKGIGVQREITRKILDRHPQVVSYSDAPPEAGGWGATVVELRLTEALPE